MAPRKKKLAKTVDSVVIATKPKGRPANMKSGVKSAKTTKVANPKKNAVKKSTVRKARVKKPKGIIVKSNENFEKFVENIRETQGEELLSEKLENSSTDSQDYSSVEFETSLDSQAVECEDTSTSELTEQLENLEVQENQEMNEIIEFDPVDNVVTVDYVTQEDDNSINVSNSNILDTAEVKNDEICQEKNPKISELDSTMNEIEQNLSMMMNESVITDNNEPDIAIIKDNESDNRNSNVTITDVKLEIEGPKSELERKNKPKIDAIHSQVIDKDADKPKKSRTRKHSEPKQSKPTKRETKKKEKLKPNKQKSKPEELDDGSIRRSSRIKSINVLKKPSVGHGLVKMKECEITEIKHESEIMPAPSVPIIKEPADKPIKVKSRWRRSSELEMNVSNSGAVLNGNLKKQELGSNVEKANVQVKDEMVENRLKQFIHLKENSYLTERFICKEAKKMTCDCFLTSDEITRGEMACGEDCLNRLLMIECGNLCQVGDRCANKKFQKGQFAPVEVFNTQKKGLGLRAAANIPYGEFILEYVGEVLNADEFDKRVEEYSKDKNQHYYFMSLRADAVIDATHKGNISRFINHSCEPNAETQKWTVNGELRIGFFSTRTILAGEEVTFDYRFERYGKEAQKCFCDTSSCRGWLGEEPDEDDDEEDEEEESVETSEAKVEGSDTVKVEAVETSKDHIPKEEKTKESIPAAVPKIKKTKPSRKLRKELFEDDQLDEEIEMLITTGLKNQAHTLKLSRLMLRAKEPSQRAKLLKVLRRGELPCRRLFLDYHGLRLMHGYMTDTQHLCMRDKKYDSLRLEMLQTLAVLPISNKTVLQDSKVLPTVEKWSVPLSDSSPLDSNSNSPRNEGDVTLSPVPSTLSLNTKESDFKSEECEIIADDVRRSVGMDEVKCEKSYFKNTGGSALAEEIVNIFEDDNYVCSPKPKPLEVKPLLPNYEEEIIALASKLLEAWSNLKEVFRIPKKERIEQMKEHEREANKGYIAGLGLEQYAEKKNETRYRGMQRSRQQDKKNFKMEERSSQQNILSKQNRRKLFALQVEQQEEEERRRKQREMWRQHEQNCMLLGTDPRFTAPFDPTRGFQCIWNPQIGQWQNYPIPPQNQSSIGYAPLPNLPNTNVPPPNMAPYGMPPLQIPPTITTVSSVRGLPHMAPPLAGRTQLPPQIPPTNGSNIHNPQALTMPPPITIPQTPPPLSTVVPNPYQSTGYSPQIMVGQGQSPVIYQQEKKNEIISIIGDVKFLGPIPPPVKLPPKWKCAKDKYGRPYYYHIKLRKSQWEPPPFEVPPNYSESSSSESSSSSSDISSNDSDSDDEIINDSRLLRQVKKQLKVVPLKKSIKNVSFNDKIESPTLETKGGPEELETTQSGEESSIDRRLKEQFNLLNDEIPPFKRKRPNLVEEIIISPRTEEDKLQFREDVKRYKENKVILKKQKEIIFQQTKKQIKEKKQKQQSKEKLREMKYSNSENAKRIKENFRASMANTVVSALNNYRKADCKEGRITNTEDFKHLARKLTHFVMLKEMKYISEIEELVCSDNVKAKARDYIKKYMSKFGEIYVKRDDEPEHYY